jgi:hypothetical protein
MLTPRQKVERTRRPEQKSIDEKTRSFRDQPTTVAVATEGQERHRRVAVRQIPFLRCKMTLLEAKLPIGRRTLRNLFSIPLSIAFR